MNLAFPMLRHAGAETLPSEQALRLLASGGQLVDIRAPDDFGRDALPGALNLPLDALCYETGRLKKWRPVILYSSSGVHSVRAARLLAGRGFSRVYQLSLH